MKTYYLYFIFALLCFLVGGYVWRVANTGNDYVSYSSRSADLAAPKPGSVLVTVGNRQITYEDLDFEYSLQTKGIFDSEDLTPIPDLGAKYEHELTPLKEGLLSGLIERKLLYLYSQEDRGFNFQDPARFVGCLEEWKRTIEDTENLIQGKADQERLKERLCEKSIIKQYLDERLFARIKIEEAELERFYNENKKLFVLPQRVVIRQIVLPSENAAKKARHGLNRRNFAERAKELSIAPEAVDGGKLGPFAKGELPRVFDIAFSMRRGDIYGIHKSTYGFHLIMLEKKLPKEELSFAQARDQIHKKLMKQRQEKEFQEWVEMALSAVHVRTPKPLW